MYTISSEWEQRTVYLKHKKNYLPWHSSEHLQITEFPRKNPNKCDQFSRHLIKVLSTFPQKTLVGGNWNLWSTKQTFCQNTPRWFILFLFLSYDLNYQSMVKEKVLGHGQLNRFHELQNSKEITLNYDLLDISFFLLQL